MLHTDKCLTHEVYRECIGILEAGRFTYDRRRDSELGFGVDGIVAEGRVSGSKTYRLPGHIGSIGWKI